MKVHIYKVWLVMDNNEEYVYRMSEETIDAERCESGFIKQLGSSACSMYPAELTYESDGHNHKIVVATDSQMSDWKTTLTKELYAKVIDEWEEVSGRYAEKLKLLKWEMKGESYGT